MRRRRGGGQSGGDELGLRSADIGDLETEVMKPSSVLRELATQRVIGRERLDELEVRVAEIEVREADGTVVDNLAAHDGEAEFVVPDFQRVVGGRDADREVIEALMFDAHAVAGGARNSRLMKLKLVDGLFHHSQPRTG